MESRTEHTNLGMVHPDEKLALQITNMTLFEYQITDKVSQTPYATLFQGFFLNQDGTYPCLLKLLHLQRIAPDDLAQIKLTYKTLQQITDETLLQVVSVEDTAAGLLLIFEDFSGVPLDTIQATSPLPLDQFFQIAIPITKGITTLHAHHLTHTNIKPGNILLDVGTGRIKLWNVGMLPFLGKEIFWQDELILQDTLPYISPEQSGRISYEPDYRTDFYSLGITFYQLLTGKLPFFSDDPLDLIHSHLARQPLPLVEHRPEMFTTVSDIVMKLLDKEPDARYQSGRGLVHDLTVCQRQLAETGIITPFTMATRDESDRFLMPKKLYGRDTELSQLQATFGEVSEGATRVMFVAGSAGVGKSVLIQALQKTVIQQQGFFLSGKFDPINRTRPYSGIIQAIRALVRCLLGESDSHIQQWQEKLQTALGQKGQLLINIVPEVEQIIGPQLPVTSSTYGETQNQIQLAFLQLIRVFAQKERPLILFVDDLHWADNASIQLLKQLIDLPQTGALFLIGAYRDDEIETSHPTAVMLAEAAANGYPLPQLTLGPLDSEAVHEWLTDALNKPPAEALVTAIYQKTAGNPFFIKTFMRTLLDQDLLFHHIEDGWQWRLTDIDQLQITENAAELKAQQINQFPDETRELLMTAACLGASFDLEIVAVVSEISQEQTYIHLRPALKAGLLLKRSRTYRFAHDRIHEATCSLMTSETLIARHLFIGRLLLARIPETAVTKQLFTIVNQLNAGIDLVTDRAEKIKFARLNMQAGQKALKATAYESAVIYLRYGHRLLPDDCWQTDYNLAFKLHRLLAEAEYLAANYARADALYPILFKRAQSTTDKLELYFVQIAQYHLQGKFPEALAIGKEGLILLGIDLSNSPTSPQQLFAEEVNQFEATLQTLNVADLLQASPMTAPQHIQLMQLLSFVSISAFFTDTAVQVWTAMKMVNMSLAHGHHETSAFAYAGYGHVVGIPLLHEVENSYRLGKIGFELAQKQNNLSLRGKTYFRFGYGIVHWREHISATVPILRDAYRYALEGGNLTYAGYALFHWLHNRIISGQNLAQLQVEAQEALPFLQRTNANFLEAAFRPGILQALASLLGQTDSLASFNNDDFDEAEYLAQRPHVPIFISAYYCAKIRNLYFLGCYEEGLTLLDKLDVVVTAGPQAALVPETTFFLALTLTAVYADADESAQAEYDDFLNNFQTQFRMWTENCPDNYEHKYLLLQAEQARLNRQIEAAIALYRQSIKAAQQVRFFHMEALGNELYGRFWLALGEDAAAEIYLSRAYNLYRDWGSVAKIRQIETGYPDTISAAQNVNILSPSASILSRLDLLTVVKSAQAISGEINLDKLLSKMMAIIVENAGAQKGVLITEVDGRLLVQAEWIESETPTKISQKTLLEKSAALAPAIVNYVKRTGETVIISDAHQDPQFAHDPYVTRNRPKSILCMPLLNQGRLVAILYLENNLTAGTFTPERLDILSILSSQAAVSIENATLYVNLQVSARKYRNLFEGSQDAIFITTLAGRFIDMNPAGLIIIGFAWEELRQRHVVQMYANPADRAKFLETIQKNNDVEDFETDLRRKDGAIIHVLITATTQVTEDGEIYFQGIIRDITEQKRAEAQLHTYMEELERSNQELQQFAYIASHDLQEPLRKVRTFGDRLETRYGDVLDQHGQDYLNRMQNAATRMQTLIEDLLTFSRVTTRIRPFALADLNWVVREVLRDLEVRIEELQAQVIVRDLPVIEADQVQMRLLFQNLISNALKFHRAEVSPLVRIEASLFSEEYESWCQITVVDNGIGFEEKYLDRIFTVFQRLHGRTKYAGTGIGLAICRRIVERHKGQITAVSQPGKGASFIITLPVRQS